MNFENEIHRVNRLMVANESTRHFRNGCGNVHSNRISATNGHHSAGIRNERNILLA